MVLSRGVSVRYCRGVFSFADFVRFRFWHKNTNFSNEHRLFKRIPFDSKRISLRGTDSPTKPVSKIYGGAHTRKQKYPPFPFKYVLHYAVLRVSNGCWRIRIERERVFFGK